MSERYAVVGPPGTGKTTYLKRQVERATAQLGPAEVMVSSLTRAAAAEIRGRDLPIPADRVGTLHSFAYRSLGNPPIAESKLKEWNTAHPHMALSASKGVRSPEDDKSDERSDGAAADDLYETMNLLRHRMRRRESWPISIQSFAKAWEGWMGESGYCDFTGLIENAYRDSPVAPGNPLAVFVDEAQDMSALEVALASKWSSAAATTIFVGDPAQALYEWRAADPEAFFSVGEPGHRKVLGQSWRVPKAPHAKAVRWAGKLLDGIEYLPVDKPGFVDTLDFPLRYGDGVAELVERHLSNPDSGTIMIQALCSYMLQPLIKSLREAAIPFHNPLRTSRGDWNPLGDRKGTSTKARILAFLTDDQSSTTAALWMPMLQAKGVLARGAKERIKDGHIPEDPGEVMRLFESEDVAMAAFSGDLGWLTDHVTSEFRDRIAYPARVVKRRGVQALQEEPRVLVGTIHSFKGGEADRVLVAPDLSPAAHAEHLDDLPGVRRAFYVAMTRTRDRLEILAPSSRRCVELT